MSLQYGVIREVSVEEGGQITRCTSIFRYEDVVLSNHGYSHENAGSWGSPGAGGLIERYPRDTNAVTGER